jgi:hypothetical protein
METIGMENSLPSWLALCPAPLREETNSPRAIKSFHLAGLNSSHL